MTELSSSKLIVFDLVPTAPAQHPCALRHQLSFPTNPGSSSRHTQPLPGLPILALSCKSELIALLHSWFLTHSQIMVEIPCLLCCDLFWVFFYLESISSPVLFSGSIISSLLKTGILFYFVIMSNICSPLFFSIYVTNKVFALL